MTPYQIHATHAMDVRSMLADDPENEFLKFAVTYHELQAARHKRMEDMTDMDRLIAAADALADAIESYEIAESAAADTVSPDDYEFVFECWDAVIAARKSYRAAREAITRGTPPATSA